MYPKQILVVAFGSALLLSPPLLAARPAQDQGQESVVDAARKAREAKKTAPKAKIVLDDDNLDTIKGSISVVGPAPVSAEDQAKIAAGDKTKAPGDDKKAPAKGEDYWRQKFADANKKLADDMHEADVDQRDYNLKQQQYYSDPNTAMKQQYNRQDLNDLKKTIDDKTAAIEQDKQAISDLQDELRQAGGEPGWATPPASTPPPATTPAAPAQ
jgi:hypothetical protein